ncbi:hypothetical protein [Bacillus sp. ISL-7]|uniref:hypothetical protein n=1 Tax=Bacillus sp. ISL-7 TaxID=2819136 RepID=UPI001BE7D222|nr:hypothetical protein [Bacillus sp. ISL-7]MBT2736140.1 hypothetical protein [Bacillus sp. ISL-7]
MMKTQTEKKSFTVFTEIQIPVSVSLEAHDEFEAIQAATLKLDQNAISAIVMNFILSNGTVYTPNVLDWKTTGYEVFED